MLTAEELKQATPEVRKDVAKKAVAAAPAAEKKDVATAALDELSADQRKELVATMFPTTSADKKWVYIVGFCVAGAVALGLALIAWGAQSGSNSISTALIVLATGFSSAIIGGLLGVYVQK
jgi:hypothetical protein